MTDQIIQWKFSQPTPPLYYPPNPYMTHSTPTPIGIILNLGSGKSNIYYFPHLPNYHPPHPCMTHPTTPHDTPHPTPAWHTPTPTWSTPPHPYMTHPTPTWPTPPLEQFWEEMGWISWGPSLCLPFGRQLSTLHL